MKKFNETVKDENGTVRRVSTKIGRNQLCPCGSNNKYKRCCGK